MPGSSTIISREAYRAFVSFIFAAAMVAWGTTLCGLNPLSTQITKATEAAASKQENEQPPVVGLAFIKSMPWQIRIGGVLYAVVLICFYWIYSEHIIPEHLPTNIWNLPADFIALSFMAGASAAWVDKETFVFLSTATLVFLTIRFLEPAWRERTRQKKWRRRLMTQLVLLYVTFGGILSLLLLGALLFSKDILMDDAFYTKLYVFVQVGMFLGICLTGTHA